MWYVHSWYKIIKKILITSEFDNRFDGKVRVSTLGKYTFASTPTVTASE